MNSPTIFKASCIFSIALGFMTTSAFAAKFGMFTYKVVNAAVTITDYPESAVGEVVIPPVIDGMPVTIIGSRAFENCAGLTGVTIPNSITRMMDSAFSACTGLAGIAIPNSITRIPEYAFFECTGLASITIPASVKSIGVAAFTRCTGLTSITLPDGVKLIEGSAFYECTGLSSVTIPDSIKTIEPYVFFGCTGLTNLVIPHGVKKIEEHAFANCTGLTGVTFLNGVEKIGYFAFAGCSGLISVDFPKSLTGIRDYAFNGCSKLVAFSVDSDNPAYSSKGGVLFNKEQTTLIVYCPGLKGDYVIPDDVVRIRPNAFRDCTKLTKVTIPDSITSIGESVFSGCAGLTKVNFANSVTHIQHHAFSDCIGLTRITFPKSITKIQNDAFSGCSAFEDATFQGNAPELGTRADSVFDGASESFTIYFYEGKAGFTTPTWNGYPTVELVDAPTIAGESQDRDHLNVLFAGGFSGTLPLDSRAFLKSWSNPLPPAKSTTGILMIEGQKYRMLVVKHPPAKKLLIEVSGNLVDWTSGARYTTVISESDSVLKVRDNTPLASGTKRFIRARAMVP